MNRVRGGSFPVAGFCGVVVMALGLLFQAAVAKAEISDDAKRLFNSGVEYEKAEKADSAITAYEAAIAEAPEYLDARINVGALYYQKGSLVKAAEHLKEAIKLDSTRASAHKNLALVSLKAKEYGSSIAAFDDYLKLNPKDAGALASLAQAYKESGDTTKAMATYNAVLKVNAKDHRSAYNLGNLLQKQKKYEQAIAAYRKAIAANPKYVGAYYNLAICSHQVDFETCIADYQAFIKAAGTRKKWRKQVTQVKGIIEQITDYLDAQTD